MKSKTLTGKNGNTPAETLSEVPVDVRGGLVNPVSQPSTKTELLTETELEEVEGYVLQRPGLADIETANKVSAEADTAEQDLEESGFESISEEFQPLDALFASYQELLPLAQKEREEVIIGPDNRVRITPTTSFPWRAICGLKITAQNGSRWIGTGWLVAPRTIITAGHCVYMHDQGGWARRIEVIPGLNDAARPYGSYVGTTFRSVTGWTSSRNRDYDYGAIILPPASKPGNLTGTFGFAVRDNAYLLSAILNLSGYPGDKGGNQQWFMAQKAKSVSSRVIFYEIDTIGGQSGAPVWVKVGTQRFCVGIHTNGHLSGNSATRIVQPVFNNIQAWKAMGM